MNISEDIINKVKSMANKMDAKDYPEFDTDKNLDLFKTFPFYYEAGSERFEAYINVSDIVGDNWAFDKIEDRGNYPRRMKIMSILDYYKGIRYRNQELPPVDIININDVYHLSEGNHRLYVLKWLEHLGIIKNPTIKANIVKYDYDKFLKEGMAVVEKDFNGEVIKYIKYGKHLGFLEMLDDKTYKRLLELKNNILNKTKP